MANTTIGAIILQGDGNSFIRESTCRKEAILAPQPLYEFDSNNTDVFDFGGVIKTITLTGVYDHSSGVSSLKTWVDDLEALIQGHQDKASGYPLTFVDDLRGTKKVKVMDFDTTWVEGEPTIIVWTLKLVESSENA